ncbi:MAG: hypothetical protein ACK4UN_10045 [Limisphaerales bacterium]
MSTEIDSNELRKLSSLLEEYTEKLRAICHEYDRARERRVMLVSVTTFALAVAGAALAYFFLKTGLRADAIHYIAPAAILFAAAVFLLPIVFRVRRSYDADQLAATVKRLIKLSSQYNEHAQKRIADRFEFELRLAEAEGVLETYHRMFHRVVQTQASTEISGKV